MVTTHVNAAQSARITPAQAGVFAATAVIQYRIALACVTHAANCGAPHASVVLPVTTSRASAAPPVTTSHASVVLHAMTIHASVA